MDAQSKPSLAAAFGAMREKYGLLAVLAASVLWLILRSGAKPSRISYPCQQAAIANSAALLAAFPLFLLPGRLFAKLVRLPPARVASRCVAVCGCLAAVLIMGVPRIWRTALVTETPPSGFAAMPLPEGFSANTRYQTIPAALALPSPHRVISVHNSKASTWEGSGNPRLYLGPQGEFDRMVEQGVTRLTGAADPVDGWRILVPYQPGEAVAIKLNFNNLWNCSGFGSDPYMNPYAPVVNAVIRGLKSIGVPNDKIWITDPSRPIGDFFRAGILPAYNGVKYFTKCDAAAIGSRLNVFSTGYVAKDSPFATALDPAYGITNPTDTHIRPAQVFVDAAHIINIP